MLLATSSREHSRRVQGSDFKSDPAYSPRARGLDRISNQTKPIALKRGPLPHFKCRTPSCAADPSAFQTSKGQSQPRRYCQALRDGHRRDQRRCMCPAGWGVGGGRKSSRAPGARPPVPPRAEKIAPRAQSANHGRNQQMAEFPQSHAGQAL